MGASVVYTVCGGARFVIVTHHRRAGSSRGEGLWVRDSEAPWSYGVRDVGRGIWDVGTRRGVGGGTEL